jgi:serine/threonine protein kinase
VLVARQEGLGRTVALKRVRPDKLNDAARRRFLREANITACLQHHGIVPIYGLGWDDDGPFYTMPFIEGQTLQTAIDAYHADESLEGDPGKGSLRFRGLLQRFIEACNAMAYAHDQGVIHRDLKPSNIMLVPYGQTLVMDWGLAKRLGAEDGQRKADLDAPSPSPSPDDLTATGAVLGTPEYMSPEQARGEPAGPASDIFSLGLILSVILTGKPDYDAPHLRCAKKHRTVEREAPVVLRRSRDMRLPRGLEAIRAKAMALNPKDRYPDCKALAHDVERWLADEPVSAWREPLTLRARRWMRRRQTLVTSTAAVLVFSLLSLACFATVLAGKNRELDRQRNQAEAVSNFLVAAFRSPDPAQDGRTIKMVDVLDRASAKLDQTFTDSQAVKGALFEALGLTYRGLGLYDRALTMHAKARAVRAAVLGPDHGDTLTSAENLAIADIEAGRPHEGIALLEAVVKSRESQLGLDHQITLTSRNNLANGYWAAGRFPEAIALHEATLKRRAAKLGADHRDTIESRNNLAVAYEDVGRLSEAIALYETTLAQCEAKLGAGHADTLGCRKNLASAYRAIGRLGEAIALNEATLMVEEEKLGPDHPDTLMSRNNLAECYMDAGRLSAAIALFESTLKLFEAKLGSDHPLALTSRRNLAVAYEALGWLSKAESLVRDVLARRRKAAPLDTASLASDLKQLGRSLLAQGRFSEAEPPMRQCLTIFETSAADDWTRYDALSMLGAALLGQERYAEAESALVAGYEGLKTREMRIPMPDRSHLDEAAERVVRLYEEWNKPHDATIWKTRVGMRDLPSMVFAR